MRATLPILIVLTLAAACGDDDGGGADAGGDGGLDAGLDAGFDAGPMCAEECGAGELCCPAADGAPTCIDVFSDPRHCGGCSLDCIETGRGTVCDDGICRCGSSVLGCPSGTECCPPRPGGTEPYCANFATDSRDCGGCGMECEEGRADRCDGFRCLCGDGSRRQCDGTPEDRCCAGIGDMFGCVDTTADARHCGGCGNSCGPGESCVDGSCVVT